MCTAGAVSVYAGLNASSGYADGPRTGALFSGPAGLAITSTGYLAIADKNGNYIRAVSNGALVS